MNLPIHRRMVGAIGPWRRLVPVIGMPLRFQRSAWRIEECSFCGVV
jgi:hypothetical protein